MICSIRLLYHSQLSFGFCAVVLEEQGFVSRIRQLLGRVGMPAAPLCTVHIVCWRKQKAPTDDVSVIAIHGLGSNG